MKTIGIVALVGIMALSGVLFVPPPARAQMAAGVAVNVDVGTFYDALAPYGNWIDHPGYGPVWTPAGVPGDWRPYTHGRWAWTDEYGWTWVSDYEWGWAPFHYGRWFFEPALGWAWVPGSVWGPAWVAWRQAPDSIGWAPLPPAVAYAPGVGLALGGVNLNVLIGPAAWCFVPAPRFLAPNLYAYAYPPARNVTIIHNTTIVNNYTVVRDRVVNRGFAPTEVRRWVGRPVPVERVRRFESQGDYRAYRGKSHEVAVYTPRPQASVSGVRPLPPQGGQRGPQKQDDLWRAPERGPQHAVTMPGNQAPRSNVGAPRETQRPPVNAALAPPRGPSGKAAVIPGPQGPKPSAIVPVETPRAPSMKPREAQRQPQAPVVSPRQTPRPPQDARFPGYRSPGDDNNNRSARNQPRYEPKAPAPPLGERQAPRVARPGTGGNQPQGVPAKPQQVKRASEPPRAPAPAQVRGAPPRQPGAAPPGLPGQTANSRAQYGEAQNGGGK